MPTVQDIARDSGVGKLERHVFLCRGPKCCPHERAEGVWKFLKNRLKELGLAGPDRFVGRSKADCLRVCQDGPIALVYPEGAWYDRVDETKMERIIQGHCVGGRPLDDAFAVHPLTGSKT